MVKLVNGLRSGLYICILTSLFEPLQDAISAGEINLFRGLS